MSEFERFIEERRLIRIRSDRKLVVKEIEGASFMLLAFFQNSIAQFTFPHLAGPCAS